MTREPNFLPLSFLNQYLYCPRRFWLMFCQSEMEINAPVLEGQLRHQHAHTPGQHTDEQGRTVRSVQVWSDRLRIIGIADFVETRDGTLIPLEHKRGRMGRWLNDHVQVCAQAMCLEERLGVEIAQGEIFYWANRRRERVPLDAELRARTEATVEAVFALLAEERLPPPLRQAQKCRDCSLEPVCLPRETLRLVKEEA